MMFWERKQLIELQFTFSYQQGLTLIDNSEHFEIVVYRPKSKCEVKILKKENGIGYQYLNILRSFNIQYFLYFRR